MHRRQVSKEDIKRLFYRNETTFSFKKYVTNMKQTFNVIENYNVPLYDEDKFRQLLDKINFLNNYYKTEVNICRFNHSDSFTLASTYLLTCISRLFPATQTLSGRYGTIKVKIKDQRNRI